MKHMAKKFIYISVLFYCHLSVLCVCVCVCMYVCVCVWVGG